MRTAELSPPRLDELIARFPQARIAVLGDFFLDKYLHIDPDLEELSVETGKAARQVVDISTSPGAAGTVTGNLAALGAGALYAVGFSGDDGEGLELRRGLSDLGCDTRYVQTVSDRRTPTYLKPRNTQNATLAGEYSRYDTKNRVRTRAATESEIIASIDALLPRIDALVIVDQVEEADCGVVTAAVRQAVAERARSWPQVVFWADSRRRIGEFRRVIIKPNQFEAVGDTATTPGKEIDPARLQRDLERLHQMNGAPVVATRGRLGMIVSDPEWTQVPAVEVEGEVDPTGAGDSASAGAVIALCAGAELPEAAVVGSLVAAITVKQIGQTGVARPAQLPGRLRLWRRQVDAAGSGQRVDLPQP